MSPQAKQLDEANLGKLNDLEKNWVNVLWRGIRNLIRQLFLKPNLKNCRHWKKI